MRNSFIAVLAVVLCTCASVEMTRPLRDGDGKSVGEITVSGMALTPHSAVELVSASGRLLESERAAHVARLSVEKGAPTRLETSDARVESGIVYGYGYGGAYGFDIGDPYGADLYALDALSRAGTQVATQLPVLMPGVFTGPSSPVSVSPVRTDTALPPLGEDTERAVCPSGLAITYAERLACVEQNQRVIARTVFK